ncbi:Alpha/beta hydrolase fold-1 [Propionibacterium ruminifibrarum]|uniref:Alpha/beta hydrolase fold-1 n=1 Tax=Propionibacterium ruminifibrarum TaxID=1962131 RepID=A0A375I4T3_9ACTN|nr:alpha/beta fold hydrolase [Propionibacterium ruminifibrarum]SPF69121.1 Alpha/beta hydrolase fold-1 [Propionibacterium ruminifibrarum]
MVDRVQIPVPTERGTVLPGTLFREGEHRTASTCVVAITGIHGNFWSNPFYFPMGDTLATTGIDFVYAETSDARGEVETVNVRTGRREIMGSFNEDFAHIDDDVGAYVEWARREGYDRVVLAGHSLGANKVIHYLSTHRAPLVSHFVLLSPANMDFLLNQVDARQRDLIDAMVAEGRGGDMLPFALFGWAPMLASTAYQWTHDNPLDSVHLTEERDFSQVERVEQPGPCSSAPTTRSRWEPPPRSWRRRTRTSRGPTRTASSSSRGPGTPTRTRSSTPPTRCATWCCRGRTS